MRDERTATSEVAIGVALGVFALLASAPSPRAALLGRRGVYVLEYHSRWSARGGPHVREPVEDVHVDACARSNSTG